MNNEKEKGKRVQKSNSSRVIKKQRKGEKLYETNGSLSHEARRIKSLNTYIFIEIRESQISMFRGKRKNEKDKEKREKEKRKV